MNRVRALIPSVADGIAAPVPLGIYSVAIVTTLVVTNQIFNVGSTVGFALSGLAATGGRFVLWQAVGSVFGLGAQVTFAGLVRYLSLSLANAIGIGLAFVSAQVFAAFFLFHESFSPAQWLGTGLVFAGILCIAFGR